MDCIDSSDREIVPVVEKLITNTRAWLADDIGPGDWTIKLGDDALAEISTLVREIRSAPLPMMLLTPDAYKIPVLRDVFSDAKDHLDHGCGFCVIDRLPMGDFPIDDMIMCYWVLGQLIGRTVAQKWDGTMIYDVKDTGHSYQTQGVRGSYTNVELVFHTDNAFGISVPDYVGLLCRHPAKTGGLSRFCSLYSIHNRMLKQYPAELKRLYQPMLFDRQDEHAPASEGTTWAPFFSWRGDKLAARANTSLVRKGYAAAGKEMDQALIAGLGAMDQVSTSDDLWIEAPIMRGQMQYLNNNELGHYRSTFEDFDDPAHKRHLYRTWHRERGRRSYDE